ncbi:PilZ domain-containing protein [Frateuria defendens]|uniref:PilZ domain-containing protein n=1 Tax=Frateuria defendens TaxID=2219559 RepID=UPI00069CC301|nr:PilZ domain-containing protein [Frateuria defendens]
MATTAWSEFSQRMAYEGLLPLGVESLPAWPDHGALAAFAERNANVLGAIGALDERRTETPEDDSPLMQEVLRLGSRLNVLMEIVNRLLVPPSSLPPRGMVRLNALGAVVPAGLVAAGDGASTPCLLRLHFDACPALPLELPARVGHRLDDGRAFLLFEELGESVGASLDRLVFRHHRRKVAGSRQGPSPVT